MDIRVRPPKPEEEAAAAAAEADVFALKPGERPCEHADCRLAATAKAPKSRERMHEHYWFCQAHAAEYNKSWNFFAGMSDEQIVQAQAERATGERPTWSFKASNRSREAAAQAKGPMGWADPFSLFGFGKSGMEAKAPENARHLGKLERNALADLDLAETALGPEIRARYTELVKRCHPDSNGGDRSAENRLQRVIKAYKTCARRGWSDRAGREDDMEASRREDEERALALAALSLVKATIDVLEAKGVLEGGEVQSLFERALMSLEYRAQDGATGLARRIVEGIAVTRAADNSGDGGGVGRSPDSN